MSTGVQRQQRRDRIGRWIMDDKLKIWTTVGSAGILNQADLAKVTLHGSIIQIGVNIVLPPQADAAAPPAWSARRFPDHSCGSPLQRHAGRRSLLRARA
jgi:hypothetical protein